MSRKKPRETRKSAKPVPPVDVPVHELAEIDIHRAIDESANRTTLEKLVRRGYSEVKVLHRDTISTLIKQAVSKSIENRAAGMLEEKRAEIQEESTRLFRELLEQYAPILAEQQQAPIEPPHNEPGRVGESSEIVPDGTRMDAIEDRMEKLLGLLGRAEQVVQRLGTASRHSGNPHGGSPRPKANARAREILEEIFKQNLKLQEPV
jgi:hypothetical protein